MGPHQSSRSIHLCRLGGPMVAQGVSRDLLCHRCDGVGYPDDDGDMVCISCGLLILLRAYLSAARDSAGPN